MRSHSTTSKRSPDASRASAWRASERQVIAVVAAERAPERAQDQRLVVDDQHALALALAVGAAAVDPLGHLVDRRPAAASRGTCCRGRAGSRRRSSPPRSARMPRQIHRPSPVPTPSGLVVKNGSKMRARISGAMPAPVSRTSMITRPSRSVRGAHADLVALGLALGDRLRGVEATSSGTPGPGATRCRRSAARRRSPSPGARGGGSRSRRC